MSLTEIGYGSLASSEVMNNNFEYLDNKISDVSESLISMGATINSNVATLNSSLSSTNNTLTQSIDELDTTLTALEGAISASGVYVTTYVNGSSWYRAYYSDAQKTTRVWLEQGGLRNVGNNSQSTVTFLQQFSNTDYTVTIAFDYGGFYKGISYNSKNKASMNLRNFRITGSEGGSNNITWYACGV